MLLHPLSQIQFVNIAPVHFLQGSLAWENGIPSIANWLGGRGGGVTLLKTMGGALGGGAASSLLVKSVRIAAPLELESVGRGELG
jgi:hypothetical protein